MTNQGLGRGKCIGSAFLSEVGGGHAEGLTDPLNESLQRPAPLPELTVRVECQLIFFERLFDKVTLAQNALIADTRCVMRA